MTHDDILANIESLIEIYGSARALANHWGISVQYLCDIRKGRRQPGNAVLSPMGLTKHVTYTTRYSKAKP